MKLSLCCAYESRKASEYNELIKTQKFAAETLRQGNLGDKLTPAFDKVMTAQKPAMDYQ